MDDLARYLDDTRPVSYTHLFGTYEAGFLSELNCPEGLSFSEMYKENEAGTKATGSLVTSFDNIEIDSKIKDRFTLIKDENNHVIGNCQINIYLWYSSYSVSYTHLDVYKRQVQHWHCHVSLRPYSKTTRHLKESKFRKHWFHTAVSI